ncbi:MAG: ABC transporter permease subunit [bacterium]|nr:ABC transporter permease subunit [bacterium]
MGIRWKNVNTVFRKELLDIVRDRRTIISMIVIPLLLFPVLIGVIGYISVKQIKKMQKADTIVVLVGGERSPALADALRKAEKIRLVEGIADTSVAMKMLRDDAAGVVTAIPANWTPDLWQKGELPVDSVHLYYLGTKDEASFAVKRVIEALQGTRDQYIETAVVKAGLPASIMKPFVIYKNDVSTLSELGGKLFGMWLPYMLILLSLTGAMYPAIDLTAGEKERGTLETLLLSPAGRSELALGKFMTVMVASLVTSVLTIISIGVSTSGMLMTIPMEVQSKLNIHIDATMIITVLVLMIPLSAIFASLLLAIALNAKSYKEAQSYIQPLMIVVILPAIASTLPGMKTTLLMSLIPVLNVSLLIKDAFSGINEPLYLLCAAGSTVVLAIIAIRICVTTFNKESVLFRI